MEKNDRKMKILQLCNKPPLPATDGGCMAMHAITKGLLENGHSVNVLALFTDKHPFLPEKISAEYLRTTKFIEIFVDTRVNWVEAFSNLITRDSYNLTRFFTPDMDIELTRILKNESFDIIQLESLFMCPYIETIRKYSNAKIILRAHNLEYKLWERRAKNETSFFKRRYKTYLSRELKKYELHYMSQVDGIASISNGDKEMMLKDGITRPIVTIPFGIDPPEQTTVNGNFEEGSLFHLGSMDWNPNIEGVKWFCEEIIPDLRITDPGMKFYLAGKRSQDLINDKDFRFAEIVGEVESAQDFIRTKDIMVVPLKSAGGMRVKIIEGLAMGKAIVSTSIGLEGIAAKNEEHIMIADTKDEYVNAIKKLKNEPKLKNKIERNARKLIEEKYFNKVIIKDLEKFYTSLTGS